MTFKGKRYSYLVSLILLIGLQALSFSANTSITQAASVHVDTDLTHISIINKNSVPLSNVRIQVLAISLDQRSEINVGSGSTNSNGYVQTTLNPPPLTNKTFVSSDGYVNYELRGLNSDGSFFTNYHFARHYGNTANKINNLDTSINNTNSQKNTQLKADVIQSAMYYPNVPVPGCSWVDTSTYWDTYTVIGEIHTVPDVEASFSYGQTADSDIGVEFTATGDSNTYSDQGQMHISNSLGSTIVQNVPSNNSGWGYQILSIFHFVEQQAYCPPGGYRNSFQIVPRNWDGGIQVGADESRFDNHPNQYTIPLSPNGEFTRTSNQAYTYSDAVCIFVCVTASSGYSLNVTTHWKNDSPNITHYLYGNDDFPTNSTLIYASSN